MEKNTKIFDYLTSIGFTKQPVRIPSDTKETIKRDFYIVKDKSNLIFKLLNKVFPIKYSIERPDKSDWFKYESDSILIELNLKPESKETINNMIFSYSDFNHSHLIIDVYLNFRNPNSCDQPDTYSFDIYLDSTDDFIEIIKYNLMKIPTLKERIRETKLSSIL